MFGVCVVEKWCDSMDGMGGTGNITTKHTLYAISNIIIPFNIIIRMFTIIISILIRRLLLGWLMGEILGGDSRT